MPQPEYGKTMQNRGVDEDTETDIRKQEESIERKKVRERATDRIEYQVGGSLITSGAHEGRE